MKESNEYCCSQCGSTEVTIWAKVNPNTKEVKSKIVTTVCDCNKCKEETTLISKKQWQKLKKIDVAKVS